MKKKIIMLLFAIMFTVPLLTSCYDYNESNDIAYIVAIGIDEGSEEGIYNYTLQFARPSEISGGSNEEGGSGKNTISLVNVDAPSIYAAVNLGNHVISKTFTLSHTKIIVISDTLAKKSINPMLDSIGRSSDIRPTVFMCVSNGEAKKYLESVNPVIEINPIKYYRLIFENPNSSYFPKMNAKDLYFNLKSGIKQSVIPFVGVAEENKMNIGSQQEQGSGDSQGQSTEGSQKQSSSSGGQNQESDNNESDKKTQEKSKTIPVNKGRFEYNMKKYIAGELDIKKENSSEAIGSAVFKKDKMIGTLSNIESEIYNIITGDYQSGYSVIYSEKTPDIPITLRIEQNKRPKIKLDLSNENPQINIDVSLEGNFKSLSDSFPLESELISFEEEANIYVKNAVEKFLNKTTQEFDSDIVGFGDYAKKSFLTYDDFINYDWGSKYKNAQFDVKVDFQIRRTGLIVKEKYSE